MNDRRGGVQILLEYMYVPLSRTLTLLLLLLLACITPVQAGRHCDRPSESL